MKKRKQMTCRQALAGHAGCIVELGYRKIDDSYPDHEKVPVATAPAIFVWADHRAAVRCDETRCRAVYWLRDIDCFDCTRTERSLARRQLPVCRMPTCKQA